MGSVPYIKMKSHTTIPFFLQISNKQLTQYPTFSFLEKQNLIIRIQDYVITEYRQL